MTAHTIKRRNLLAVTAITGLLPFRGLAQARNSPIRWVLPFPAGAASDVIARAIAQSASRHLGQPIIIDNKAGGDGIISAAEVARAKPDGLTLLFGTNSALSASPALKQKLPYDPQTSFDPIAPIGRYTFFLFVNTTSPARSVPELIALAREAPGKLNYATGNTTSLVSSLQFNALSNIKMTHVPYKGEPAAIVDLLSNQVQVMFANPAQGLPHVESGKLRILATTSTERSPLRPEVPTMVEAGVKGFNITSWAGLFAPRGTPAATLQSLQSAFTQAMKDPEVERTLRQQGFVATPGNGTDLKRLLDEQLGQYRDTIRAAGIQPE
jgi:tripartite-type tricarboxylate transporter receptor subunit TctC